MIVVSDTSPIANLLQIGHLNLLHEIFGEVFIPPAVHREIIALEKFGIDLLEFQKSDWIRVHQPIELSKVAELRKDLDEGESEAIVLAEELHADWILLDERAGTKIAETLGLQTIGSIGILIKAKEKALISGVIPVMQELRAKAGFWISDSFLVRIKEMMKE
ncbi:MAG: DUF3368 domain-containing protein [Lewinellaceae bacterium]|nr:DUF3368 domain-containing protein [Lewinellaceae bacterium]